VVFRIPRPFDDYSKHPARSRKNSASGRYQIIADTYDGLSAELGTKDFSPHTQDLMAVRLLESTGALKPLLAGDIAAAIHAASPQWNALEKGPGKGNDTPGQSFKTYDWIVNNFEHNLRQP
jgi:muramidase (phage lysozyme)